MTTENKIVRVPQSTKTLRLCRWRPDGQGLDWWPAIGRFTGWAARDCHRHRWEPQPQGLEAVRLPARSKCSSPACLVWTPPPCSSFPRTRSTSPPTTLRHSHCCGHSQEANGEFLGPLGGPRRSLESGLQCSSHAASSPLYSYRYADKQTHPQTCKN